MSHQTILVLDFGSQFTQLIARRLRELSVYSEIMPFDTAPEIIRAKNPVGLILSGGPKSVSEHDAPKCHPAVLEMGLPTLGICYGMQLMTDMLGGEVAPSPHREFGFAAVTVRDGTTPRLFRELPADLRVWASHGDFVAAAPPGFAVVATSANAPVAAMEAPDRGYYALLFHPEVAHTERGKEILRNFAFDVCGCTGDWTIASFIDESIGRIRQQVGDGRVVCALSGGVDSTVAATLIHRAIGDRLQCIFVDNGVLRLDEARQVVDRYKRLQLPVHFVDASDVFLARLAGVSDPEEKRKVIGATFIDVFEQEALTLGLFDFLAQGTLYP
ncbi:MAG: glutamine-hydrolyzing GMP synthase, partial [Vicinamibacterales bacterium]